MANTNFMADPYAHATCSLAGLPTQYGKIAQFSELAAGLRDSLRQIDGEKSYAQLLNQGLFAARLIKATCDGFISTTAVVLPENKGVQLIADGYGILSEAAGAASTTKSLGGGGAEWTKALINTGAVAIKRKLGDAGLPKGAADNMIELGKFQSRMVVDAFNKDDGSVIDGLISASAAVGKMANAGLKNQIASKIFGIGDALATAARGFVKAYKDFKEGDDSAMFDGLKRSLIQQLRMVEQRVTSLQRAILEYERARADALPHR